MPFGTSLFLWLRDNKYAQWLVGGVVFVVGFLSWQRLRDMRIRREANEKLAHRIERAQEKHEEKVHEAGARVTDHLELRGLRDTAHRDPSIRGPVRRD